MAEAVEVEEEVIALVNVIRGEHGLQLLRHDHYLALAARAHATDMARLRYFAHDSREGRGLRSRVERAGYLDGHPGYMIAENIAKGHGSPAEVVEGWMASPGHRANILQAKYSDIGVACVRDAEDVPIWVQVFGTHAP